MSFNRESFAFVSWYQLYYSKEIMFLICFTRDEFKVSNEFKCFVELNTVSIIFVNFLH